MSKKLVSRFPTGGTTAEVPRNFAAAEGASLTSRDFSGERFVSFRPSVGSDTARTSKCIRGPLGESRRPGCWQAPCRRASRIGAQALERGLKL